MALRPGQFTGVVLKNGSHVDSLIGGLPIIDLVAQLLVRPSPPGNTAAVYTLADGWINDMYAGKGPAEPQYGLYGAAGEVITLGPATAVVLGPASVVAPTAAPAGPSLANDFVTCQRRSAGSKGCSDAIAA
ncbi:hypothetical protein [Mycobacterium sp. ITM-2016-00318]|uniref:hypothetical protein n=1 Tax=Mycobacterium sp. ITM-2016-00318 TaxID=2099693 RepID=UPI000CFA479E|nr:hypothetical protein [Mycobacterium sp. ITM-2016-00318]WNG93792.1 hypothetical protein C6A82_004865 [Mycobacterium sp. ITM-2016-00318]